MMKLNNRKIKYALIPGIVGIFAFTLPNIITTKSNTIWLEKNPIKCLGNAWEFNWLVNHPNKYNEYPSNNPNSISSEEIKILKDYYKLKNINIINTKSTLLKNTDTSNLKPCDLCSCPQGYTLYISTDVEGAKRLLKLGWNKSNAEF